MKFILNFIASVVAVIFSTYLLPGVTIDSFTTAVVVAVVLGLVNTFIRPLIVLLTLPITVFTLGLFRLVINAGLVMLVSWLISGFTVDGFVTALLFSIVLSIVNGLLDKLSS